MADIVKTFNELKLDMKFSDQDTRMLTVPNPKSDLEAAEILDLQAEMVADQPLIGDKAGAAFVGFNSAKILEQTRVYLDLDLVYEP